MSNTTSLVRRIRERNSAINLDINSQIKHLQRQLVSLSFSTSNVSTEYLQTLSKIKSLRNSIFKRI
ncbi:MAG: hypothetical protein L3J83_01810 [Proteobacteria bacterium]|nr:hypothetical protein [Pseudomonadota bacterium]